MMEIGIGIIAVGGNRNICPLSNYLDRHREHRLLIVFRPLPDALPDSHDKDADDQNKNGHKEKHEDRWRTEIAHSFVIKFLSSTGA
jgi:hypothetical protein